MMTSSGRLDTGSTTTSEDFHDIISADRVGNDTIPIVSMWFDTWTCGLCKDARYCTFPSRRVLA